jgi:CRISPR-associated protein Cmr2
MGYDFFAEFWDEEELDEFIRGYMKTLWEHIWETSPRQEKDRPKEFEKEIPGDLPSLIYDNFTPGSRKTYDFLRFLKILDQYILEKEDSYRNFLKTLEKTLEKYYDDRSGERRTVKPDFPKELVKTFYKTYLHDKKLYDDFIRQQLDSVESLNILPVCPDLSYLPPYSFFLSIEFSLEKPFISKDDDEFYIHDNPISKEKVFKVPYVRASSWKGNLRWAAYKKLIDDLCSMSEDEKTRERSALIHKRLALARMFGNEKDIMETFLKKLFGALNEEYEKELGKIYKKRENEEISFRGRLQFYPTFFNMVSLDIINPHDRKTRTGTVPITLEVVPETAKGVLSLLYVPFRFMESEEKVEEQVSEDLEIVYEAIRDMLMVYGFSAKKTSGYGVANTFVDGILDIKSVMSESKRFKSFDELTTLISNVVKEMGR